MFFGMKEENENINREFDRLLERYGSLITLLCLRASFGNMRRYGELRLECFEELIYRLPERMEAPEAMPERQWVWWRCRNAIAHYLRRERFRAMLPLPAAEAVGGTATHEVTQLTVDELASYLAGTERRCFLLMVEGVGDDELARRLNIKPSTLKQLKYKIKKTLYEKIKQ